MGVEYVRQKLQFCFFHKIETNPLKMEDPKIEPWNGVLQIDINPGVI